MYIIIMYVCVLVCAWVCVCKTGPTQRITRTKRGKRREACHYVHNYHVCVCACLCLGVCVQDWSYAEDYAH